MNIITHDCAYSLYPDITFIHRSSLFNNPLLPSEKRRAVDKYSRRDWTFVDRVLSEKQMGSMAPGLRYFGDDKCWVVNLFPSQTRDPSNNIKLNSWTLKWENDDKPCFSTAMVTLQELGQTYLAGNSAAENIIEDLGHWSSVKAESSM